MTVANVNKMYSSFACKNFGWKMQGVPFTVDMMILPLGGCDVVLGVQWLVILGDINWNFHQLKMEFHVGGKKISIRGMQPSSVKVMSKGEMHKILNKPTQIAMMHVGVFRRRVSFHATTIQGLYFSLEGDPDPSRQLTIVRDLLTEFLDLFEERKALPPRREHDHNITLKPDTSPINVEYLGHLISSSGVAVDPQKVQGMMDWPEPKNVKELRGFVGLICYYRRFMKDYGKIAKPLTKLLRKGGFTWTVAATHAFHALKKVVCNVPMLALSDFSKEFIIETNASGEGIGAVLQQQGRPIIYISKALASKNLFLSVYEKGDDGHCCRNTKVETISYLETLHYQN
ncbi:UNVERIFIED_CONTAM: putative mitochondrial protein [Sesamum radiatum]|uniref:Mitochondrial protein n=1 Tax=Sesamum radiatum TaxID=300843 RepID=A0AAW2M079_SESRA